MELEAICVSVWVCECVSVCHCFRFDKWVDKKRRVASVDVESPAIISSLSPCFYSIISINLLILFQMILWDEYNRLIDWNDDFKS